AQPMLQSSAFVRPLSSGFRKFRTLSGKANVILSEASLRAKSKDPHLVASSAWVADPSQANVILSEASLRAKSKDPQPVASSGWVADPSQAQDDTTSYGPRSFGTLYISHARVRVGYHLRAGRGRVRRVRGVRRAAST